MSTREFFFFCVLVQCTYLYDNLTRPSPLGTPPIGAVQNSQTNEIYNIQEACDAGLISETLKLQLYECQAATGGIIDFTSDNLLPVSSPDKDGRPDDQIPRMTSFNARQRKVIKSDELENVCLSSERACVGFKSIEYPGEIVNLKAAVEEGQIDLNSALRLWSAQLSTGGIIDSSKHIHVKDNQRAIDCNLIGEDQMSIIRGGGSGDESWKFVLEGKGYSYSELIDKCEPLPPNFGRGLALVTDVVDHLIISYLFVPFPFLLLLRFFTFVFFFFLSNFLFYTELEKLSLAFMKLV